jgi:hypothetical protein
MRQNILIFSTLLLLFSCSSRDFEIVDLTIGEQKHIVGDHYDSEMTLCFKEQIGKGNFSFSLFVKTYDGREFKFSHDVYVDSRYTGAKSTDKCVTFNLRPYFNSKGSDKEDLMNLKSMSKGNLKEVRVGIWDSSFEKFVAEKTFNDL